MFKINLLQWLFLLLFFLEKFEGSVLEFSQRKCTLCQISFLSSGCEKELDMNINNYQFLKSYHEKLVPYLFQCFNIDPRLIQCFMFDAFVYSGRDWSTSQKWLLSLKEHIACNNYLKELNGKKEIHIF